MQLIPTSKESLIDFLKDLPKEPGIYKFLDEKKKNPTTQALSKDIKEELNFLQDGGDMFTPDDDLK